MARCRIETRSRGVPPYIKLLDRELRLDATLSTKTHLTVELGDFVHCGVVAHLVYKEDLSSDYWS